MVTPLCVSSVVSVNILANAEICQVRMSRRVQEDVLRFQVAMNDPLTVRMIQRRVDLIQQDADCIQGRRASADDLGHVSPHLNTSNTRSESFSRQSIVEVGHFSSDSWIIPIYSARRHAAARLERLAFRHEN